MASRRRPQPSLLSSLPTASAAAGPIERPDACSSVMAGCARSASASVCQSLSLKERNGSITSERVGSAFVRRSEIELCWPHGMRARVYVRRTS